MIKESIFLILFSVKNTSEVSIRSTGSVTQTFWSIISYFSSQADFSACSSKNSILTAAVKPIGGFQLFRMLFCLWNSSMWPTLKISSLKHLLRRFYEVYYSFSVLQWITIHPCMLSQPALSKTIYSLVLPLKYL